MIKILNIIILAIVFFTQDIIAQQIHQTSATAGGNASGSGGSAAFTIGQLVYSPCTTNTGSVTEGINQPFEIYIIDAVYELTEIELEANIYPNPTSGFLTLKIDDLLLQNESLSYQLFDLNGKLLKRERITGIETKIEMQSYFSGTYFIKVINSGKNENSSSVYSNEIKDFKDQTLKTFKIIKN